MPNQVPIGAVFTAFGVVVVGMLAFFFSQLKKKRKDLLYVKVGKIGKIFFYPVKSLKGIEVQEAKCTKIGIKVDSLSDRSFMLVSENGNFISQRKEPRLALLTPRFAYPYIYIDGPNVPTLKVPIQNSLPPSDKLVSCKVWEQEIRAIDCGDEAALWFQNFLEKPGFRLVQYLPSLPTRPATNRCDERHKLTDYPISFQDGVPFHLLSQSSIDDLNSKLDDNNKISVGNFHPNFVAVDCQPFEEDKWKHIRVSSGAGFIFLRHCDRCGMTTVNPETGVKTRFEPLETLKSYRMASHLNLPKRYKSPLFGIGLGLEEQGEIKVDDDVFAYFEY